MFKYILIVAFVCLIIFVYALNPLRQVANEIVQAARVFVWPQIKIMDKSGDRLFVLEPEEVILYNTNGALYYYFEGGASGRLCPNNEHAVVRITLNDIGLINENGRFNITCSSVGSWAVYNHFQEDSLILHVPNPTIRFTLIEVINFLIDLGLVDIR